jgi:pimeloyl-ACP methyl ester carboxylesterase
MKTIFVSGFLLLSICGLARAQSSENQWRLVHPKEGVVLVWHPQFEGQLDGIVVYVHGDSTSADEEWEKHGILQQFRESGSKSLFIVPTMAQSWKEPMRWKGDLEGLIQFVTDQTQVRPKSEITLIGHSAGFRTVARWLGNPNVRRVILLDALYGYFPEYRRWLQAKPEHQLVLVATKSGKPSTKPWAKPFAQRIPGAVIYESLPAALDPMVLSQSTMIYIETDQSHNGVAWGGKIIPMLL